MNVPALGVSKEAAAEAVKTYRVHRDAYDKRDWEIERIYRAISRGRKVISVQAALEATGFDEQGRPKLGLARADWATCRVRVYSREVSFIGPDRRAIKFPVVSSNTNGWADGLATVPRIPPQHRPAAKHLSGYHILFEADWRSIPADPYLLKKIGKDAWAVVAAWDLTEVELLVMRSNATH